jgi:hypothetical protein
MNKKITVLLALLLICFGSCRKAKSNLTAYNEQLTGLKGTKVYKDVQERANKDLKKWLSAGLEEAKVLNDCNWKVDDAVFFNSRKNKCYLLLALQDKAADAELDYVYVMYGALEHNKWTAYFVSLPSMVFPRDRFSKDKYKPIPFPVLSQYGRDEVLKDYYKADGSVNDSFIESNYTSDLKKRHREFLQQLNH